MSRRHHGRSRHARGRGNDAPRTPAQVDPRTDTQRPALETHPAVVGFEGPAPVDATASESPVELPVGPTASHQSGNGHAPFPVDGAEGNGAARAGCTAPQLRRFIKSRPYVPMHELRRRFGINGAEDEVSPLPIDDARVYVGLPERECRLLGELVRGGEVGYELSLDPRTPIVVGVYPMRPVPRA